MAQEVELPIRAEQIQKILPHRYPFLMVDEITAFEDGVSIVGKRCVSSNEPFFQGHFPNRPIMPGVMILEALAQLGAIFAKLSTGGAAPEKLIVFSGADRVRFRRPVYPGDVLELHAGGHRRRNTHWWITTEAKVDGLTVAEALVMATEIG